MLGEHGQVHDRLSGQPDQVGHRDVGAGSGLSEARVLTELRVGDAYDEVWRKSAMTGAEQPAVEDCPENCGERVVVALRLGASVAGGCLLERVRVGELVAAGGRGLVVGIVHSGCCPRCECCIEHRAGRGIEGAEDS